VENKETFDAVAREYDRFRPAYPNELFSDIIDYSGIHQADQILEIGCGTGQATTGFIRLGYRHMTCVELGKRLAQIASEKFNLWLCIWEEDAPGRKAECENVVEGIKSKIYYF
jgi:16S rRNA A1518/A1519 N6-dimethyltransferase RsmA/KsgA/DIM1 with predicted DNA glycosylase/AP lyase activity